MEKKSPGDTKFLYEEYKHCFDQLRYYDTLQSGFLKYSITISTAVLAFIGGFYEILPDSKFDPNTISALICGFLFLSNLMLLLMMVRNRVYYVFCASQINAIRKYLIDNEIPNFMPHNKMYVSNLKGAKIMSTQMILNFGINTYASIFLLGTTYFLGMSLTCSLILSLIFLIMGFYMSYAYINSKTNLSADTAINKNI